MLFSSLQYLIFLGALFLVYYLLVPARWKWLLLLLASAYFYYSWNSLFLVIIAVSILIDYLAGQLLGREQAPSKRRFYLLVSVVSNIGLLFVFKYLGFVVENLNTLLALFGTSLEIQSHALPFPVGISFYTFQTLSYTIDIYKGYRKPEKNMGKFALYVLFFPQLLAGPIERSRKLLPQIHQLPEFNYDHIVCGLRLILWGAFKKMVIGDRMGEYVDMVYAAPDQYQGFPLMLGSALFTLQVYCDFSGYTDMAIGSARLFGIKLSKNFDNRVYFTATRSDFWKGWHITLNDWFRDYLFFTVVGRSRSSLMFYSSLVFVFMMTGLWHGAGWGFIIWGALNGLWVAGERLTINQRSSLIQRIGLNRTPNLLFFLSTALLFSTTILFAIPFRAETWDKSMEVLQYSFMFSKSNLGAMVSQDMVIIVISFVFMDVLNVIMGQRTIDQYLGGLTKGWRWFLYLVLIELILAFGLFENTDFYYFRF